MACGLFISNALMKMICIVLLPTSNPQMCEHTQTQTKFKYIIRSRSSVSESSLTLVFVSPNRHPTINQKSYLPERYAKQEKKLKRNTKRETRNQK